MKGPRKVSPAELRRLKKKGKVRKKLGAQPVKEQPVSEAPDDKGMSGSVSTEPPAPAPLVPPPAPAPLAEPMQPMASMSASMELRDGLLQDLIQNNTRAIDEFRLALTEQKPRQGIGYRHKVNRDTKTSLIEEIISTPIES